MIISATQHTVNLQSCTAVTKMAHTNIQSTIWIPIGHKSAVIPITQGYSCSKGDWLDGDMGIR